MSSTKAFVTLGMFIIDDFSFKDADGNPTERTIGGGGTYASIGARIWLPPTEIGMIVDRGYDFPTDIQQNLLNYGDEMWLFRDNPLRTTTRALNSYCGELRGFEYTTPRIRITPKDLEGTPLAKAKILHFICSPNRASAIMAEVEEGWNPITVYEPIPDRCIPEELPALQKVLPLIYILSPNAEEALSLLSVPLPPTKETIEKAADEFLVFGVGPQNSGWVVIRSGGMGAYIKSQGTQGKWVDAFWTSEATEKIVDVTGAGNSFLGGFVAGMVLCDGDIYAATLHATVSASFVIEQEGLPAFDKGSPAAWNGDSPLRRLEELKKRHEIRN
ncbi:Ribokinase-like protein [Pholiota conissans]|uniref:Ribokinase-like protein n=1 Tax=Pholiota conissans TaxID=109636 RepID=A0A9P5ZBW9_9AGAR|nr:Ribokinase-like protein [Pholiota conissans]